MRRLLISILAIVLTSVVGTVAAKCGRVCIVNTSDSVKVTIAPSSVNSKIQYVEVLSDTNMKSVDDYSKSAMQSKNNNPDEYVRRAKSVSDEIDRVYRNVINKVLLSQGVTTTAINLTVNSRGKIEAFSIPYKKWYGTAEKPTEGQVLILYRELVDNVRFKSWEGLPEFIHLVVVLK